MKKIIINLMSIVLLCSVFCPVCAQQDNSAVGIDDEIAQRTKFKTISDNNFQFPSSLGSAEVFTEGKRLLDIMERKSTTAQPQPYLPPELSTEHGVNDYFLYYYRVVQPVIIEELDNQDLKHYQDFYRQIVWKKNGIPDLTKAATVKSYLAFYNLINNQSKPSRLQVGRIDEHFPLLGVYADSFKELQERFGDNSAYLYLIHLLDREKLRLMIIPQKDAEQAEEIAKQMLYHDFQNYGMTKEQADQWFNFATSWKHYEESLSEGIKGLVEIVTKGGNWYLTIFVRPGEHQYRTALHEFQHVKDFFPGWPGQTSLCELTTSVHDVVVFDTIYREIHNINSNNPVIYKHDYEDFVDLGGMALFFRNLSNKYQSDNYAELLLTQEAQDYIEGLYNTFLEKVVISLLENKGIDLKNMPPNEQKKLIESKRYIAREYVETMLKIHNGKEFMER